MCKVYGYARISTKKQSIERQIRNIEAAYPGAVIVHVKTVKGKGYEPAEQDPSRFHGIGPFVPATGRDASPKKAPSWTESRHVRLFAGMPAWNSLTSCFWWTIRRIL